MNGSFYFSGSRSEMLFNREVKQSEEKDGEFHVFNFPMKNTIIALLDHPSSITVYQHVSIEAISGSVSVFGYELKKGNLPLKVFSSERTGLIEVKTETFDRIWRKKADSLNLKQELYNITEDNEKALEILQQFGHSTVAVVIRACVFPPNLQYLELYYPLALEFNLFKEFQYEKDFLYVPRSKCAPVEFNLEAEKIASDISIFVRNAKLIDGPAPRVLICGPRNTGKSSLLRYLINRILSIYVAAYYLDTDPGQTEFTPPGLVSLTKITKPIVGPPFAHQRKPVSMIFTGAISADSSPQMYCKSICKLTELYTENFSHEPLFINTMGWMEGLGLYCLQNAISAIKPTVLIELVNEDETSMFDYRECMPEESHYFQLCSSFILNSHFKSPEMRNLSLLSYFGKCQNSFEGPQHLNAIKPYRVSWDKIAVYMFGQKVPPYRMIEALNCSVVALCKVPETVILESDILQYPKTVQDDPDNECIGYGLVRAIDEKEHTLYIISPLNLDEIKKVNAIIKGNVMVPPNVILNQPIYEVPLPFTNERDEPSPVDEENIADYSLISLESISAFESPSADLTARGSAVNYRRKVPKRNRLHMHK